MNLLFSCFSINTRCCYSLNHFPQNQRAWDKPPTLWLRRRRRKSTQHKKACLTVFSCFQEEESESNPTQRLVGGDVTQSSYSSVPQVIRDPQTNQSNPEHSLEKSSTSVYYTPSGSLTASTNTADRPLAPEVKELNAIPC